MKLLTLPIVSVLCICASAASTQVVPPSTPRLRSFAPRAGQQRASASSHLRRAAGSSRVSPRPMATPPVVTLPSSTIAVGFQTAPHFSSGTTTGGSSTTPYRTVLGDFDDDGKMDVASVVQDIDGNFWISVLLSNG